MTALLLGALIIQGIQPGPLFMTQRPDLFWGIVASMYVGNVFLLLLNLPLVGLWAQLLRIPYRVLFPDRAAAVASSAPIRPTRTCSTCG